MDEMASQPTSLRIAALILPPIQLLDLSPVDLFHMLSKQYLQECNMPAPFLALGLDAVTIHYVAEHGPKTNSANAVLAETTASAAIRITTNFDSPVVQPGAIDILFVPGPDPSLVASEAAKAFIVSHARCPTTTIVSVCTGIYPLAQSGILEGRACTGPRALLGMNLRKDYPYVKWTEKRWEIDSGEEGKRGELWTAGGITNGQDMVAALIRRRFKRELADLVSAMADVGGRQQEYTTGPAVEGMWWGFLLLRSWFGGLFAGGGKREVETGKSS